VIGYVPGRPEMVAALRAQFGSLVAAIPTLAFEPEPGS
jgi:hypothetical protein